MNSETDFSLGLVSVVIPTCNRLENLLRCLTSLKSQSYPHTEIIIVDNNASESTAEMVAEHFPQAQLIREPGNIGAWTGRNRGIDQSRGEYILLLDDDTEIDDPLLIEKALTYFACDNTLGCVAFRILDGNTGKVDKQLIPRWDRKVIECDQEVAHFVAAGAMVQRKAFYQAGRFWDLLTPYYGGDMELGYRLVNHGYRILQVATLNVKHWKAYSGRYYQRAHLRIRYGTAHVPLMALRNLPYYCVISLSFLAWSYYFLSSLRHRKLGLFIEGIQECIQGLPAAFAIRKSIGREARNYVKKCRGRYFY